jgi:lactate dehydrogenase-like 2-hydroxyacid dehydrogenase
MKASVLVTKRIYPEAVDLLEKHFTEVDYVNSDEGLPANELIPRSRGKDAIVSQLTDKFTPAVLEQLDQIRVISNVAVGFDNIDVPAATRRRILVTNTPDVLTDTTADLAWALMMAAARRIVEGHAFVHSGKWQKWTIDLLVGQDIHHRTIGLFGLGRIGQAVARRARGFDMRVLYHDALRAPERLERELEATFVSKEDLLRESDFISLHVPLLESTRHMIAEPELQLMKRTAILVNTARGPVVDEAALAKALKQGWIASAGIDVFEREPQVHPELLEIEHVVLAPHIGSASVDTRRQMSLLAAQNAIAGVEGKLPPNLVNTDLWKSLAASR